MYFSPQLPIADEFIYISVLIDSVNHISEFVCIITQKCSQKNVMYKNFF